MIDRAFLHELAQVEGIMSSIFGFMGRDLIEDEHIDAMLPWNRFYGEDGEDTYKAGNIVLGCCVQELSDKHRQEYPILHDDNKHAVIDAVIYNRDELLGRCDCDYDASDAELLFKLVMQLGFSCLAVVNGDFAGAVYDEDKKSLTLFRDHMGVRPLFYYKDNSVVAFSTDLRGLFANPDVRGKVDDEWIYRTVAGFDADTLDNTPYENVKCVTPAHFAEISFNQTGIVHKANRYWKLGQKKIKLSSKEEYCTRLRTLVEDSVKRRLGAVSGIVGAELSGGLDSGVIDILISRFGREAVFFSWSLDPNELDMAEGDERKVIADICKQENITCNYMHLESDCTEKAAKSMERAGLSIPKDGSMDLRFVLPASSNTYTLLHGSFYVREHGAKVMFTGHGGDEGISHRSSSYEMFHHHEYYRYFRHLWSVTRKKNRVVRTIQKGVRGIVTSSREKKKEYTNWYASPELLNIDFAYEYLDKKQRGMQFDYDPVAYIENGGSRNRLENMALLGAYCGVRYIAPFMDFRVMDFAVSIPRYLYINGGTKRYIYREAFKDIMPKSLYELNIKEVTSFSNLKNEVKANWFEEYARRKREIIDSLDRDYWKKYLDFVAIDKLYSSGEPTDEEYTKEMRWLKALLKCALEQNIINRAKMVNV